MSSPSWPNRSLVRSGDRIASWQPDSSAPMPTLKVSSTSAITEPEPSPKLCATTGAGGEPSTWSPREPRRAPGTSKSAENRSRVINADFLKILIWGFFRCSYELGSRKSTHLIECIARAELLSDKTDQKSPLCPPGPGRPTIAPPRAGIPLAHRCRRALR
eukprot:4933423-Pyramimonas_sp.AAC.1